MSVDSLSKDTGMTSSGKTSADCGSNRMTSATSVAVTVSKYERRRAGSCNERM